jgi:hypothetical protein
MQLEGLFDVPPSERSRETWRVEFDLPQDWRVGAIVGPSGSGKTTVARELFGDYIAGELDWPAGKSVLDAFPQDISVKEITRLLSSVGFSSPPSWVRPYRVLSTGEQFRVTIARTLAENKDMAVVDEFTSVVDRTVAQIGSAAIAKTVRRRGQKFIAVSCHYDILDWLEPDWVYQPHTNEFYSGRYLHRRPLIELEVKRVHHSAWQLFRKHHYLSAELNTGSRFYVAFWRDSPVAFVSVLNFPHPDTDHIRREHRLVCLPDFQGVGIGNALSHYMGSVLRGIGLRYYSRSSHPGVIASRAKSLKWRMKSKPALRRRGSRHSTTSHARGKWFSGRIPKRMPITFEYVGPALDSHEARCVYDGACGKHGQVRDV